MKSNEGLAAIQVDVHGIFAWVKKKKKWGWWHQWTFCTTWPFMDAMDAKQYCSAMP
jgi:hypothetical protein